MSDMASQAVFDVVPKPSVQHAVTAVRDTWPHVATGLKVDSDERVVARRSVVGSHPRSGLLGGTVAALLLAALATLPMQSNTSRPTR